MYFFLHRKYFCAVRQLTKTPNPQLAPHATLVSDLLHTDQLSDEHACRQRSFLPVREVPLRRHAQHQVARQSQLKAEGAYRHPDSNQHRVRENIVPSARAYNLVVDSRHGRCVDRG